MGVKLSSIIQKESIDFKDLTNKRIAIDFSNTAYQFLSSIRQQDGTPLMDSKGNITSVYTGILTRFTNLMQKDVKLVVVFDGKPPILKIKTQEERELKKQHAEKKLALAHEDEDLEAISKYSKQTARLSRDIIQTSKDLVKALGLPIIQAPSEADAQMAFMNEKDDVWACGTSDIDCLLHGAKRLVTNLTLSQKRRLPSGAYIKTTPEMISSEKVLSSLNINQDQLIVISILCGTDYNQGIHGIGPKKALKLVQTYHDFDEVFKAANADFNWKKIYATFKSMPIMKNYQLKFQEPNLEAVKKILVDKHEFSEERVESSIEKITKRDKSQKGLGNWV